MTNQEYEGQWHLSRAIPISVILYLTAMTFGGVFWIAKTDSRLSQLELADIDQKARLSRLEETRDRVIIMEERQLQVLKRLDIQAKTMQDILELVTQNAKSLAK